MWQKCWNFYRLASEAEEVPGEVVYKNFIDMLKTYVTADRDSVIKFILKFQDQPYFKIEDLLAPNFAWLFGGLYDLYISLHDAYARELQGKEMKRELIKKIINYKVETQFLAPGEDMYCGDYLDLEKVHAMVSDGVIKRAQQRMILRWIRLSRSDQPHDESDLKEGWELIYNHSQLIPQQFLEELAKRFGMKFYLSVMKPIKTQGIIPRNLVENLLDQKEINEYDLAVLFESDIWFSGKHFQKLLDKIAPYPNLREFVRGYLYIHTDYYMLDEDLKLINKNYQLVSIPLLIKPIHLNGPLVHKSEQEIWQKIFDDFKVVPQ